MTLLIYYTVMVLMVLLCYKVSIHSIKNTNSRFSSIKFLLANIIPIIVYTLFWGLRYNVGFDYQTYMYAYIYGDKDYFEIGYQFLQDTLRIMELPYSSIFIVTSLINICSIINLAKGRDNIFLSLLMLFFWSSEIIYFAQNGIRQMLAISMVYIAAQNLLSNKFFRAVCFFLLAFSFHSSSVIYSVLVLIVFVVSGFKQFSINKYVVLVLYLFMELSNKFISLFDIPFVSDIIISIGYENKLDLIDSYDWDLNLNSGVGIVLRLIVNSLIILSQDKMLADNDKQKRLFYWLFVLGAVLLPILNTNLVMNRVLIYLISTNFVLYTFFTTDLLKGKIIHKKFGQFFMIIFIAYNLVLLSKNCNTNGCKEYQTIYSASTYFK